MPKGELKVNGYDAFEKWGISLSSTSLSALMTPPPQKEFVSNKSRNENGARVVVVDPRVDERQLTLEMHLKAPNETEFFRRYGEFCQQLATGRLQIETKYQPGIKYRVIYESCTQFTQFMRGIAFFTLRLTEPDPTNRN